MKKFLTILSLLTATLSALAGVQVKSKLSSIEMYIGEQVTLTVDVITDRGADVQFPEYKRSDYYAPGVEVIDVSQADTLQADDGTMTVSKTFTLTSFDEKLYALPGMSVKVNGKPYKSDALALKVLTVEVDTLHQDKFFPPKYVQNNPFEWSEWSPLLTASIVVFVLCMLCVYLAVRLKQNKPIITRIRIVKKVLPHQKALNAIDKLRKETKNSTEEQKTYYTQLTAALRQYIEERFGFNAMEMTSSEILFHLQESGDNKMMDELKELFYTADLVKFAKYSTLLNENDLNLVNAINFIDQTKIEGQPTEERIVPKLSESDIKTRQNRIVIKTLIGIAAAAILITTAWIVYNVYLLTV